MHYYLDQCGELWVSERKLTSQDLLNQTYDEFRVLKPVTCRAARHHMQRTLAGRYPSRIPVQELVYAYVKETGNLI